ncbi:MAG: hypothetical protein GQ574_25665 [Crocinitomix sp.]|nr:hypothetical protein [Crocinitomix sp.]
MRSGFLVISIFGNPPLLTLFHEQIKVLTQREKIVLYFILSNRTYKDIAGNLYIHEKTVSKHSHNIRKKMNFHNLDALKLAFKDLQILLEL